MTATQTVNIGIIGGGLMGKELTAAIGRWVALEDHPVTPQLTGVCDTNAAALTWFDRVGTVTRKTTDYRELLDDPSIDVLYIAVPHHLHERLYIDAVDAGKDFLAEKPFGIDLAAAQRIVDRIAAAPDVFVRCSSEMPFFPGAQAAFAAIAAGELGPIIEAYSSFLHSSDLDLDKPINWKRQVEFCGEAGVMNDLGMHALHLPLRLGWAPRNVFAVLQNMIPERPGPDGSLVPCDTIENATFLCNVPGGAGDADFPLTIETKRVKPGEKNTWKISVTGLNGGVEFSTKYPKTLRRFIVEGGEQIWQDVEMGSQSVFKTVTGGIFEFGFSDAILQMWAAFLAERSGDLGDRFGCATPQEALTTHQVFAAALKSSATAAAVAP